MKKLLPRWTEEDLTMIALSPMTKSSAKFLATLFTKRGTQRTEKAVTLMQVALLTETKHRKKVSVYAGRDHKMIDLVRKRTGLMRGHYGPKDETTEN